MRELSAIRQSLKTGYVELDNKGDVVFLGKEAIMRDVEELANAVDVYQRHFAEYSGADEEME